MLIIIIIAVLFLALGYEDNRKKYRRGREHGSAEWGVFDEGMNINTVREIAGHRDEHTTLGSYYYDRSNKDDRRAILERALEC